MRGIGKAGVEQPIAELVARAAPAALIACAAVVLYLALLSTVYGEARAKVRAYGRLKQRLEALERHRPSGIPASASIVAARGRLERTRDGLVREGILRG